MLACYGIPCSFTKVLKTHKSIVWYYEQNAMSRGILSLVLWSQDIVPLAEMMTRSRASSVVVPVRLEISQRLVSPNPDWITAWGGGGSKFLKKNHVMFFKFVGVVWNVEICV